jgi:PilZ domain
MSSPFFPDLNKATALDGSAERARDSLMLKAEMKLSEQGTTLEARIRNLSSGGLMAEGHARVERGETVEVNLRNIGWVTGKVAWVTENRFGVAFDQAIDPKIARKPVGQNNSAITMHHTAGERRPDPSKLRRF